MALVLSSPSTPPLRINPGRITRHSSHGTSSPPSKRRRITPTGSSSVRSTPELDASASRSRASSRIAAVESSRASPKPLPTQAARSSRPSRPTAPRPRFSSAAAAAAAAAQGDGLKPREERSWEEFHTHLDIDAKLPVFAAAQLDGNGPPAAALHADERLNLLKPNFRQVDPFAKYGDWETGKRSLGYHESDRWERPRTMIRVTEGNIEDDLQGDEEHERVEYDMDEQDTEWLAAVNVARQQEGLSEIQTWLFEMFMTKIEKEWHVLEKRIPKPNPKPPQTHRPRSSSAAAVNGELGSDEPDSRCVICDDGDCENTNAIVFCDGCDLAVHQECYGVPFIPEGQWLCRKCQLIGRGTPTCIFCPNTDGAFKQTNASRWSHLLCAIWIPELSLGNSAFMEPVMDVDKVPKQRWKLICYICRQKMGACIQCSNKNCYVAFHVTCARRARLYLRMKGTADPASLKAYCDKHVPTDWRREHDVDHAIMDAMDYYQYAMRGRRWADSQRVALTAGALPPVADATAEPEPKIMLKLGTKNANKPAKIVWKLPSGAPIIPRLLHISIEAALRRYGISEFASDLCKYWTLKREARRGAALLKRLQLQMEPFTSMEIPRRNFVGMGAAGGRRLQRRIEFADQLLEDVQKLQKLCASIVERERQKMADSRLLVTLVDTLYFPLQPHFSNMVELILKHEKNPTLHQCLDTWREKVSKRYYTSTLPLAKDLVAAMLQCVSCPINDEPKHCANTVNGLCKSVRPLLQDTLFKENQLLGRDPDAHTEELSEILSRSYDHDPPILAAEEQALLPNGLHAESGDTPLETQTAWYLASFAPKGTTVHEEQWTNKDLVRHLSEDLSDLDDQEMSTLLLAGGSSPLSSVPDAAFDTGAPKTSSSRTGGKKRKKSRRWR